MNEQKPDLVKQPGRFFSLRLKVWIGFILIFTPVFVASYFWFYEYTTNRVLKTISDDLLNTVEGAVKGMDVQGFTQLYMEESKNNKNCPVSDPASKENGYYPDNPLYLQHELWLKTVQDLEPQTKIYTYMKGPNPGEIIAIGSTGYWREPRGGFKFCERYISKTSRIYDGLFARVDVWDVPYSDQFGSWITTYMPITDANGRIVGAIGVDIAADYLNQVRRGILISGAIAFVLSYILIFFLVYWLSGLLTRPIVGLAGVAKYIGEGDYNREWSVAENKGAFRDEIDTLTGVFKVMVDKVAQREQSLRTRLHQLEIMVDRSKLENQVKEIVDSDFFQDLQSKVRGMRDRFKKDE